MKRLILCMTCAICLAMVATSARAGSKKSPENCRGIGSTVIKCYQCGGNNRYLGKAAVLTEYEKDHNGEFCVPVARGKKACADAYGVSSNRIGFYAKYKIGITTYDETYWTQCVDPLK